MATQTKQTKKVKEYKAWVPDYEHEGDLDLARNVIHKAGGKVTDSSVDVSDYDEDGEPCYEAWVKFTVPSKQTLDKIEEWFGYVAEL